VGRRLFSTVALVATIVAILAWFEGFASLALVVSDLFSGRGHLVQERYARYDADLGWVGQPNLALPNLFGPDIGLHTTARGFRGAEPSAKPPHGKIRIVCSGGSWTFGAGVDDAHTWCAFLADFDPRIETINVGQDGYGLDQTYLWYRREGPALGAAIHVLGITDAEIARMASARFLDYGKPTLTLHDGALEVANVPAWHRPFWQPRTRVVDILKRTKTYELFDRLRRRAGAVPAVAATPVQLPPVDPATIDAAAAVLTELRDSGERRGEILVIAYLPTPADCRLTVTAPTGLAWWRALQPRLVKARIRILELSEDCRQLSTQDQNSSFFTDADVPPYGSAGSYTTDGHRRMALAMSQRLRFTVEEIAAKSR
jgi:hypothetical protein